MFGGICVRIACFGRICGIMWLYCCSDGLYRDVGGLLRIFFIWLRIGVVWHCLVVHFLGYVSIVVVMVVFIAM